MESYTNLLYKNAPYLTFPNLLVLKHDYLQTLYQKLRYVVWRSLQNIC